MGRGRLSNYLASPFLPSGGQGLFQACHLFPTYKMLGAVSQPHKGSSWHLEPGGGHWEGIGQPWEMVSTYWEIISQTLEKQVRHPPQFRAAFQPGHDPGKPLQNA